MNNLSLPIYDIKADILDALRAPGVRLLLQAPTGSGKSTQVAQMILDAGLNDDKAIVILQPRRLAARLLAARVAQERKTQVGEEVGVQIRFQNTTSSKTRIKFVTEGVLLRQMLSRRDIPDVGVLIFDEFHERHWEGDVALAQALEIQESVRNDLRIVVMSATLDSNLLMPYLKQCAVLTSQGRTFPVTTEYIPNSNEDKAPPVWELAAQHCARYLPQTQGDVLVFMPGAYEIASTIRALKEQPETRECLILPLHGELPIQDQDAAIASADRRKIIVATNVAETSITIEGITLVVDSGLARIARYDSHRGINTLWVEKISQSSAEQRTGRAGRTAAGHCIRLWTERDHAQRAPRDTAEIKRLDLSGVVLHLKMCGYDDMSKFRWIEPPGEKALAHAESLLHELGALDEKGNPTAVGKQMVAFPAHPRYARMLLAAHELGCVRPVALIAALTQTRNLLQRNFVSSLASRFRMLLGDECESDFFVLMRAWKYAEQSRYNTRRCSELGISAMVARQVETILHNFLRIAEEQGLNLSETNSKSEAVRQAVLIGFSDRLAVRMDGGTLRCRMQGSQRGVLARESVVQSTPVLVAADTSEIQDKDGGMTTLLSLATAIELPWLKQWFPSELIEKEDYRFDATARKVILEKQTRFRDLIIASLQKDADPNETCTKLLAKEVIEGRCVLKGWDDQIEQWIIRVNCLSKWFSELQYPSIGPDERRFLTEQICHGAMSYKQIKDHEIWPVLKTWLSGVQQQQLDEYLPERMKLPNGRSVKISYSLTQAPVLSARIQDLYGVDTALSVGKGRVPLAIEVLAPSFRPIQITQNLVNFWRNTYPQIKQDLHRKYPKHEWR